MDLLSPSGAGRAPGGEGPGTGARGGAGTAGFLVLALGVFLLHLPMLGAVPVSGDEAYYWQCARHLDWSYFDQPPLMIAFMGASAKLLGINEWAVRLPALLTGLLISLALLWIGRRLFRDSRGPLWALAGLLATPLFSLGTLYSSTDILLCLFVLVVPALAAMAILEDCPRLWLPVGFLGGLGGLAKFSAVLYVPAVAFLALAHPAGRRHLRRPEPYLGALLGLVGVSPNFIWAARHHLDNLTFQLVERHVHAAFTWRWLGEYVIPQFFLLSPLLFPLLIAALVLETFRAWRERDLATLSLALPADTFFVFFGLVSLKTTSAPHWAAPAAIGGALVTARWALRRWGSWSRARHVLVFAALGLGFFLSTASHLLLFAWNRLPRGWSYNDRISSDTLRNVAGWPELAGRLRELEGPLFDPRRDPVVCDSYTTASLIAFYSRGRYDPLLMASAGGRHGLAYLYWQDPSRWKGRPGLYVGDWRKARTRRDFERAFGGYRDLGSFSLAAGGRPGDPPARSQSWHLILGKKLTADPSAWIPFRPEGRHVATVAGSGGAGPPPPPLPPAASTRVPLDTPEAPR